MMNIPGEITEEEENYFRLQLLRGFTEKTLRKEFHKHFDEKPGILCHQLKARKKDIDKLLQKNLIGSEQYNLLLPQHDFVYSEKFDVSLLVTLLRNLCGYNYTKKPKVTDRSVKANIQRCLTLRNRIQHLPPAVFKEEMDDIFELLEQPLIELGSTQIEFDGLKTIDIVDKKQKAE